jgi:hypothetical protein
MTDASSTPETLLLDHLESVAETIKSETKSVACAGCRKFFTKHETKICGGCRKSRYCSDTCQKDNWICHKQRCRLVRPLRGRPGYNDRIKATNFAYSSLYNHGKRYLSQNKKGCVCFSTYPLSKRPWLEAKLEQTQTSASWIQDPIEKCLYHFFILPLSAMKEDSEAGFGGFDPQFVRLCSDYRTFRHYIPMVQMKLEQPLGTVEPEVTSLLYFAVSPDEIS